jgi:N-acetylglucosaminyldiphosphoundecaprenol N-acetyl-beta-D-mannosaminyltransferase
MHLINTMGFSVYSDKIENITLDTHKARLLTTISPNSYGISTKDNQFREALRNSDYLVLDGVYFALSSILMQGRNIIKNQGSDVFYHFMKRLDDLEGKVFFLGSSDEILTKMREKAESDYPHQIACYSPPYKKEFSQEDNQNMLGLLNDFGPDIVFVGMTCPKQEKWAYLHKEFINAKLICCVGAVFDWYAGSQKPIASIWWKLRLGWLIRTIHRPEILKRYPNIGIFFQHLTLAFFGNKKYRYGQF